MLALVAIALMVLDPAAAALRAGAAAPAAGFLAWRVPALWLALGFNLRDGSVFMLIFASPHRALAHGRTLIAITRCRESRAPLRFWWAYLLSGTLACLVRNRYGRDAHLQAVQYTIAIRPRGGNVRLAR